MKGPIIETLLNREGEPVGCIEDVYGTGTSFNVYESTEELRRNKAFGIYRFYKSAYTLAKAQEFLAVVAFNNLKINTLQPES